MTLEELLAEIRTLAYRAQHSTGKERRELVVSLNAHAQRARDAVVLGVTEVRA